MDDAEVARFHSHQATPWCLILQVMSVEFHVHRYRGLSYGMELNMTELQDMPYVHYAQISQMHALSDVRFQCCDIFVRAWIAWLG